MKTRILALIAAALILTASAFAQETANKSEPKTSNTHQASCLIKITCDPDVLPLSFQTIEYLVHSSSVGGKAVQEILERPPEEALDLITIESLPLGDKDTSRTRTRRKNSDDEDRGFYEKRAAAEYKALGMDMPQYMPKQWKKSANQTNSENTLLFHLTVAFDKDVKPAATECMNAVIENLGKALHNAFRTTVNTIQNELDLARYDYGDAEEELSKAVSISQTKDDIRTRKQLDQVVDLSGLDPQMAFADAIEVMKGSVDPPLKVVVLWRDLVEKTDIEQASPINIDPIPQIQLGKALELVLKSMSIHSVKLGYAIDKGIITIARAQSLPPSEQNLEQIVGTPVSLEELTKQRRNLLQDKQMYEMNREIIHVRHNAMSQQMDKIRHEIRVKLEKDPMIKELEQMTAKLSELLNAGVPTTDQHLRVMEEILDAKMKLAEQKEKVAQVAGADRMARYNEKIADMGIDLDVQDARLGMAEKQLAEVEKQLKAASALQPKLSRIRLAKKQLQLAEKRLIESKTRLAQLMRPTVTVIGA